MTNGNICKKCGRNLSTNYKYKKCESCRNKNIQGLKKLCTVAGGVAATFILNNIFGGKNKN